MGGAHPRDWGFDFQIGRLKNWWNGKRKSLRKSPRNYLCNDPMLRRDREYKKGLSSEDPEVGL